MGSKENYPADGILSTRATSLTNDNAYAFDMLEFLLTSTLTFVVTCHGAHRLLAQH
jgi:hypothetical protein